MVGREPGIANGCTLEPNQIRRLERIAAQLGISRRELTRRIIEAFLISETWVRAGPDVPQKSNSRDARNNATSDRPSPR